VLLEAEIVAAFWLPKLVEKQPVISEVLTAAEAARIAQRSMVFGEG
jgi:hypothetical protein